MILDERTEFCDEVSVAAAAGTAIAGDVIDLGAATRDIGNGQPIYFVLTTGNTEIITGGTAGTIQFFLMSDSTADLATSPTTHYTSEALVTDDAGANDDRLNAGGVIAMVPLPVQNDDNLYERYIGVKRTIATTTTTAGTINAFLTLDPRGWRAYPDGDN